MPFQQHLKVTVGLIHLNYLATFLSFYLLYDNGYFNDENYWSGCYLLYMHSGRSASPYG